MITERQATTWLDNYKKAWETGEPDRIVALFTADGIYRETPFHTPMAGEAIRRYWENGPRDGQQQVAFEYTLWAVREDVVIAGWTAHFVRASDRAHVELDGVFRLTLVTQDDEVLCRILHEWWHDHESLVADR